MRGIGRLLACLLALLGVSGCSPVPGPVLVAPLTSEPPTRTTAWGGESVPVDLGHVFVELDVFLCTTRTVAITLTLNHPTAGVRLARWGLADHPFRDSPAPPRTWAELGPFDSHVLTPPCGRTQRFARIGLDLIRSEPGAQSFAGVRIAYRSAGETAVGYVAEYVELHDRRRA